jgi:hypothetical protein
MVQLDLACSFWFVFATLGPDFENDVPRWQMLRFVAFDFAANADLWQRFCADAAIEPDLLLKDCPGFATVKRTEEPARQEAFTSEEAAAYLGRINEAERAEEAADATEPVVKRVYRMRPIEEQVKEFR